MTLRDIRNRLSKLYNQTWFCEQTNQTHYPAAWTCGPGAGDADTSCYYDHRKTRAAERLATKLGLNPDDICIEEWMRLRDIADAIASALRKRAARDKTSDAAIDTEIGA